MQKNQMNGQEHSDERMWLYIYMKRRRRRGMQGQTSGNRILIYGASEKFSDHVIWFFGLTLVNRLQDMTRCGAEIITATALFMSSQTFHKKDCSCCSSSFLPFVYLPTSSTKSLATLTLLVLLSLCFCYTHSLCLLINVLHV